LKVGRRYLAGRALPTAEARKRIGEQTRTAAVRAGVRLKDLRDTYASHLLTRGIPIQFVSRQLGHGGVSVTEQHYA
jgi:integrase